MKYIEIRENGIGLVGTDEQRLCFGILFFAAISHTIGGKRLLSGKNRSIIMVPSLTGHLRFDSTKKLRIQETVIEYEFY